MKPFRVVYFGVLILPLITMGCEDEKAVAYIVGTVTGCEGGLSIEGALCCAEVPGVRSSLTNCNTTDEQGRFHLKVGWEGGGSEEFLIVFTHPGYQRVEQLVRVRDVSGNDKFSDVRLDVCLRPVSP